MLVTVEVFFPAPPAASLITVFLTPVANSLLFWYLLILQSVFCHDWAQWPNDNNLGEADWWEQQELSTLPWIAQVPKWLLRQNVLKIRWEIYEQAFLLPAPCPLSGQLHETKGNLMWGCGRGKLAWLGRCAWRISTTRGSLGWEC